MRQKRPKGYRRGAKSIAVGGIFSAAAVVVMLLGGILPFSTFAGPMFAGLFLMPVCVELGCKTALLAYCAVSFLSFLIVPDLETALFFVFLFGFYPIVQAFFLKIKNKALQIAAKLLLANLSIAVIYTLLLFVFASPAIWAEFSGLSTWALGLFVLLANFMFLLYDVMVTKVKLVYILRFRRKIFR